MPDRLNLVFALCKSRWHDVCVCGSLHGSPASFARPLGDQQSDS